MEWSCSSEWLTKGFAPILYQVLKNQERSLGMRRRSTRSEVEVYFKLLEWPAKVKWGWGPIYSPHRFMIVGGVRILDISNLDRVCPMGDSNSLKFGWVGYIR
jgi:hypothetical protein